MHTGFASLVRTRAAATVRSAGFTLIELLVVIGILALLMGALLPLVTGGRDTAEVFACSTNLSKMYQGLLQYELKFKSFPTQSGPKFLLSLWTRDALGGRSETERDIFFCPGINSDPNVERLKKIPVSELWPRLDDITGDDTHYAGRNLADKTLNVRNLRDGNVCLAADDNEGASNHSSGTVNYLMGNGSTRQAIKATLVEEGLLTKEETFIPVGPESPVPALKQVIAR